jgi:hypothetical protein
MLLKFSRKIILLRFWNLNSFGLKKSPLQYSSAFRKSDSGVFEKFVGHEPMEESRE